MARGGRGLRKSASSFFGRESKGGIKVMGSGSGRELVSSSEKRKGKDGGINVSSGKRKDGISLLHIVKRCLGSQIDDFEVCYGEFLFFYLGSSGRVIMVGTMFWLSSVKGGWFRREGRLVL